ncbi:MAG: hypothetical protein KIH69_010565 [Anaerolineae bacterium]|nr:hypothetical protein [Anaerolineae bacterium]
MVYLAIGARGDTWNGICEPPWLRTVADVPNLGTWGGGGFFSDARTLRPNDVGYHYGSLKDFSKSKKFPFSIEQFSWNQEVFPIFHNRLERDGWKREGDFVKGQKISLKHNSYATLYEGDPGWSWQPTPKHPVLRMFYRGYFNGHTYEFRLDDSELLDPSVDWATWDAKGELLVARQGGIQRYTLDGLKTGSPAFSADFESLNPPESPKAQQGVAPNT